LVSANITKRAVANAPISRVETDDKVISLTFDVAWGDDGAADILRLLNDSDVRATFFLCGFWVDKYPEIVREIAAGGHEIGSHGDMHLHGPMLTFEQNKREIIAVADKLAKIDPAIRCTLFRPPFGEYNDAVLEAAGALGYTVVQWDADSLDWKMASAEQIISNVLDNARLRGGSIIMFSLDEPRTAEALGPIITELKEREYSFVTVTELLKHKH